MDHGFALLRVETLEKLVGTPATLLGRMTVLDRMTVLGPIVIVLEETALRVKTALPVKTVSPVKTALLTDCWIHVHRLSTLPASTDKSVSAVAALGTGMPNMANWTLC
ncbi:hypothetical protein [Rhodococcus globerulus]|uniref:hypothetical protein n=1 Tax=Rhodococcus globerulus TaxID=33008 RepID=UPI002165FAC2|nr:hypothetical protein [Rhodococcus globerulus]